jgi:hypothetical protein
VESLLVGRRLSFSIVGAHSIHSRSHSVSWCRDPVKAGLLLARLAAHCEPAPAACLQAANGGNVTIGRHAPAISLLSSHPRAGQAASSIAMPPSQGRANHNSSCLTRHGIVVSICGDAWSKQHRLTPQPKEGPVLSADHVFFRHRLFDFR